MLPSASINKTIKLVRRGCVVCDLLLAISIIGDPFIDTTPTEEEKRKYKAEIFIMRPVYFVCAMRVQLKIRNEIMFSRKRMSNVGKNHKRS